MDDTKKELIVNAAIQAVKVLRDNTSSESVQTMAYNELDGDNKSEIQVHVFVTRREEDFLHPFDNQMTVGIG